MPNHKSSFTVLKQVDSTNNYAMAAVHEGLANHGDAVFSHVQTAGKGQRGKAWKTGEGENIALSIIFQHKQLKTHHPFELSVIIALAAFDFFCSYAGDETSIKWTNDIFWRDRKAAGILIEYVVSGNNWKWAVAGIGVNINQTTFEKAIRHPVSLKQITGKNFNTIILAKELHGFVMKRSAELSTKSYKTLLEEYVLHLYKINSRVKLKKGNVIFTTVITGVTPKGQLITQDAITKQYEFGEIEWML